MTKDDLEQIKAGFRCLYLQAEARKHNAVMSVIAKAEIVIAELEQAWAERDRLVRKLNTLEDISEQHTLISNLQQQNTELLEDVAALR